MIDRYGSDTFERRLRPLLKKADVLCGNLEAVHSDRGRRRLLLSTLEMRGDPRHLSLLKAAGFNVVNVANNHSFQHGELPYRDTLGRLEQLGVAVIGDDTQQGSRVVTLDVRGTPLHFVGYSLRPEQYFRGTTTPYARRQPLEVLREVGSIRERYDGHLICSLHWGHEFLDTPSREQQQWARMLIEAGATVVIGHHPHVLQGIERYRNGLIAYSLGNFAFDLRNESARDSICLYVHLGKTGVASWDVQPIRLSEDGWPEQCDVAEGARISEKVGQLSARLAGPLPGSEQLTIEERARQRERSRWTHLYFLRNLRRYGVILGVQSLARAALRRIHVLPNP